MDFVNNYSEPVTLAQGATSLALNLPDGEYRLTLSGAIGGALVWEIVDAVVVGGTATLTRGVEGTDDQDWFAGAEIYCALTAATIMQLQASGGGGGGSDTGWLDVPAAPGIDYVPQYRKINGIVYLRGFVYVYLENMGSTLCTLPEDCWPSSNMVQDFEVNDSSRYRINVSSDGTIFIAVQFNGNSAYVSFDFISFPAG